MGRVESWGGEEYQLSRQQAAEPAGQLFPVQMGLAAVLQQQPAYCKGVEIQGGVYIGQRDIQRRAA